VLDPKNRIFAIGNAPTALLRLCELIDAEAVVPALVIGVPVGFVNVVESKELLKKRNVPFIISEGRKGGSNVAAAIVNALLYMLGRE
jgi:precorrin-8X/cobalt-precorrin-8 methylmutase